MIRQRPASLNWSCTSLTASKSSGTTTFRTSSHVQRMHVVRLAVNKTFWRRTAAHRCFGRKGAICGRSISQKDLRACCVIDHGAKPEDQLEINEWRFPREMSISLAIQMAMVQLSLEKGYINPSPWHSVRRQWQ